MHHPHRILIIKTGALGDVVRSTILLRLFANQRITWITDERCVPLFDQVNTDKLTLIPFQQIPPDLEQQDFDQIVSLEEDEACARLASRLKTNRLTGVYWQNGCCYTDDAAGWFDLSLISRLGYAEATSRKWNNTACYQQLLCAMLGRSFKGEPYWITPAASTVMPCRIGIESHVGPRWPNKQWQFYAALKTLLERQGFEILWLRKRTSLKAYLNDIHSCSFLVCGDTLAMHLALAYKIPAVALFTCTSPSEIYDYGILQKMISPALAHHFYSTTANPAATGAIELDLVYHTVLEHWGKFYPALSQKAH